MEQLDVLDWRDSNPFPIRKTLRRIILSRLAHQKDNVNAQSAMNILRGIPHDAGCPYNRYALEALSSLQEIMGNSS